MVSISQAMSEFESSATVVGKQISVDSDDHTWSKEAIEERSKGVSVRKIDLVDFSGMGGLSGAGMRKFIVEMENDSTQTFVFKTIPNDRLFGSKSLGLPREAFFYQHLSSKLVANGASIPDVVCVHGDMSTGDKALVMEDLSGACVQSGYFFGSGSPLNWGKSLTELIAQHRPDGCDVTMDTIASHAFRNIAKIHATYWLDSSLLDYSWLRCQQWLRGEGLDAFEAAQSRATTAWKATKEKIANGTSTVRWDDELVQCMDASIAKISWEQYKEDLKNRKWTLVHGDFHPANLMWRWPSASDASSGSTVLLDWEMVGLGSGPQDLAQYMISHMAPADRRRMEEPLLIAYYEELTRGAVSIDAADYSFDECKRDFISGGTERWVWMLALLTGMCPDPMVQYFQDQLAVFMQDHNVTPESIGMPRV